MLGILQDVRDLRSTSLLPNIEKNTANIINASFCICCVQDMRFQLDLIDFSKKIEKLKTQRYVLVAVDIADRTVYTAAQKSKTAEETLRAFKEIVRDNASVMAREVTVDLGKEYALLGPYIEERGGTLRKKNILAPNTLGVVDQAIQKLNMATNME